MSKILWYGYKNPISWTSQEEKASVYFIVIKKIYK